MRSAEKTTWIIAVIFGLLFLLVMYAPVIEFPERRDMGRITQLRYGALQLDGKELNEEELRAAVAKITRGVDFALNRYDAEIEYHGPRNWTVTLTPEKKSARHGFGLYRIDHPVIVFGCPPRMKKTRRADSYSD